METPLAETYAPSEEQDRFVEIPPASPPKRAVSIRTISLFVIVLILVLGGGIWGFQQWKYGQNHVSTDDAQMDGDVVPVSTSVGGYVASVHVHENDSVVLGQELVTIDDTRLAGTRCGGDGRAGRRENRSRQRKQGRRRRRPAYVFGHGCPHRSRQGGC